MSQRTLNPTGESYVFGPFWLNPSERTLLRDGEPISLTPKAFEILTVLVRNSGHLVGKDELMQEIWPDAFVEEANITQHVSMLRKALGEATDEHRYIETVPRVGYRFIASVRQESIGIPAQWQPTSSAAVGQGLETHDASVKPDQDEPAKPQPTPTARGGVKYTTEMEARYESHGRSHIAGYGFRIVLRLDCDAAEPA